MSKAENFISEHTRNCSNQSEWGVETPNKSIIYVQPWLTPDQALRAVEIAREEELEYVKYQLELRLPETLDYNGVQVDREDFINDFIQTMKDE
jgi:hypothetical protein